MLSKFQLMHWTCKASSYQHVHHLIYLQGLLGYCTRMYVCTYLPMWIIQVGTFRSVTTVPR